MAELNDGYRTNDAVPADGQFADTPKNPGDRGFERGQTITLEVDNPDNFTAGQFVSFDGAGGIQAPTTSATGVDGWDGVVKHEPGAGDQGGDNPNIVAIHTYGVVRVLPADAHDGVDPDAGYGSSEGISVVDGSDENPIVKI